MSFLPEGYKVPESAGKYMKFEQGENTFRVLGSAITGWEHWVDEGDKRKPVRTREDDGIDVSLLGDPDEVKHFWAFPVWNYAAKAVQVLEITQRGIQKKLATLARSKWGDPTNYDIVVTKTGEKLKTEYEANPLPPSQVPAEAVEAWKKVQPKFDLERLYDNGDPFGEEEKKSDTDEINVDDIPFN